MKNLSPSELYAVNFQVQEPKYFTQIPNIIDHLTYSVKIKGKFAHKRLSVYAKELYRILRMIASDQGKSWNCTKSLAKKVGCSVGMIVKAKAELMQKFDQLDGNPLILEKKIKVNKKNTQDKNFASILCTHTIVNIWPWNNAFMATLKHQDQYGLMNNTDSQYESVDGTDSQYESVNLGTDSPHEPNNNPSNNIPLFKEQQPTYLDPDGSPSASDCFLKNKKKRAKLSVEQLKVYDWLIDAKCSEKAAFDIAVKFTTQEIDNAKHYMLKQIKIKKSKGAKIENQWGYFRDILNKKYWKQNVS